MHSKVIGMVVLGAVSVGILGCGGAAVESGSPTTTLESGSPSTPAAPNVATATISDPSGSGSSTRSISEDTLPKTEPLMPAATTGARLSETPTLDEVVAELGFEGTIETGVAPRDFDVGSEDVWLTVTLPFSGSEARTGSPASMMQRWLARLAIGAYRDSGHRLSGVTWSSRDGDFERGVLAAPAGDRSSIGGHDEAVVSSEAPFIDAATRGAASVGAELDEVGLVRGIDPAPVIRLTTADARPFLKDVGSLVAGVLPSGGSLEGWFVQVSDEDGPAFISAVANRAAGGSLWVRPDLADALGSGVG